MEEQDPPTLSLQILAGPRKDETHQFQPGSTINIGRVIRGNNLTIKDPGISTKHLTIQIQSGNWILTDLDSSNGTVLDNNPVPPNTPFHLRDGSTIKIGEVTSIVVNFINSQSNPTETRVEDKPMKGRKGNGKSVKFRVPVQSIDGNEMLNGEDESGIVDRPEPMKVTRNTRNTRRRNGVADSADGNLDAVEPKNARVTRNSKNKKNAVEICDSSNGDLDAVKEKVEELKNVRVTRNLRNKLNKMEISELFRLQEQPAFDKKQFLGFVKRYIKLLTPKLDAEKQELFKKHIEGATKFLLGKLKDLQFFVGESMHDDGSLVFAYYKEGAADPTFLYFAYALKEIKC